MAGNANSKDTIYIDVDDEITTVIDKVRSSPGRVVALVLPKRATVFQSIVNMKLLKRSAESAKKHPVLITTEAGLLPLAGAVGLHVAATPQSRPEIPSAGSPGAEAEDIADEDAAGAGEAYTAANAGSRPVGELAGLGGTSPEVETLRLPEEADEQPAADGTTSTAKSGKDKRLKVPNFNKFRARLFIGGLLLVGIIAGLYVCLAVLPKAAIAIATKTSSVNVNLTASLDPSASSLDTSKSVLPAKVEQQQKTTTQQTASTGQKNTGQTAAGSITMSAQKCAGSGSPDPVPAGTGVSSNGLTFITQSAASFAITGFKNGCGIFTSGSVTVNAQNAGAKYNVSGATFSVASRPDVSASGSASGGTDNVVRIVAQADIDSAKQKLAAADSSAIKAGLEQALRQDGKYPLSATFTAGDPVVTASSNAGDAADTVTVTQAVTYTMYGASKQDLETLIKAKVTDQTDTHGQAIVDDGLDKAVVTVADTAGNIAHISLQTTATVGPDIDQAAIKKQAAGKKIGDVRSTVGSIPGVTSVDVRLSPFWVSSVPTNPNKTTVTISGAKRP